MRRLLRGVLPFFILAPLAIAGCSDASVLAPTDGPAALVTPARTSGAWFVRLTDGTPIQSVQPLVASLGGTVLHDFDDIGYLVVGGIEASGAGVLASSPGVDAVAPDYVLRWIPSRASMVRGRRELPRSAPRVRGTDQSGAFFYADQWNIRNVQADDAWSATPTGAGTLVCVLDTGIDPGQLDLLGKVDLSRSASFVPAEPFIEDLNFHGTFVAGLIASNGIGIASVAPDATLCGVKVLDQTGSGSFSAVLAGLFFAALNGADVANLSLTAYFPRNAPGADVLIDAVTRTVRFARDFGVQVIGAAGNDAIDLDNDGDNIVVPAEIKGVIGVAANAPFNQTGFDALASYSNFGGRKGAVDVTAPGGDFLSGGVVEDLILSACSRYVCGADGIYLFAAGTSFAAPHVAGVGALTESFLPGNQRAGRLDACLLLNVDVIMDGGAPDSRYGAGRLNALRSGECQRG
ncbi:MAG: S8 family serine peptidase [Gemmatimonadetes bacterium]|nr:S8 family serine peptidase [Gemmatimonadota bacterium]